MKKVKILILAVVAGLFASCDLDLVKDYELSTNPDGLIGRTALEHFRTEAHQDATIFCDVVEYAGMEEEFANTPDVTIIIPLNSAFENLFAQVGISAYNELPPVVWRSLLKYLIFPGDYRAVTLEPNVNTECTSLAGDPIWIMRAPTANNKYRMVINDQSSRLSSSPITVSRQDYRFKHNVTAQLVSTFVNYQPLVTPTDDMPEGVDMSSAPIDSLMCIADAAIYRGGTTSNYDKKEMQIVGNRGSNQRVGVMKFNLKNINFANDLVTAQLRFRISQTNTTAYKPGQTLYMGIYRMDENNWDETTVDYRSFVPKSPWWPITTKSYINTASFVVPEGSSGSSSNSLAAYKNTPVFVKADLTAAIIRAYETAATDGSTPITLGLFDETSDPAVASSEIRVCTKDCTTSNTVKDTARIYLIGPTNSFMRILNNLPVTTTDGTAVLTPETSFAMQGPETPNDYTYSSNNIIYSMVKAPEKGVVTRFGIPVLKNGKFTQAEMEAGVVKYLKDGDGQDTFVIKAGDYIGGVYYDSNDSSNIVITVD